LFLEIVIDNLRAIYHPYYNSINNVGKLKHKIAVAASAEINAL
jgi:hypothetical protein